MQDLFLHPGDQPRFDVRYGFRRFGLGHGELLREGLGARVAFAGLERVLAVNPDGPHRAVLAHDDAVELAQLEQGHEGHHLGHDARIVAEQVLEQDAADADEFGFHMLHAVLDGDLVDFDLVHGNAGLERQRAFEGRQQVVNSRFAFAFVVPRFRAREGRQGDAGRTRGLVQRGEGPGGRFFRTAARKGAEVARFDVAQRAGRLLELAVLHHLGDQRLPVEEILHLFQRILVVGRQQLARLEAHQAGSHHQKLPGLAEVGLFQRRQMFEILVGDGRDGNVPGLELVLFHEIQQQVERPFEYGQPDFVTEVESLLEGGHGKEIRIRKYEI